MPAPYSLDLRRRVWALYEAGKCSRAEVAEHFKVSESFVRDLARRARENNGSVAPKPHGGGWPPPASEQGLAQIAHAVERKSDATLDELQKDLRRRHKLQLNRSSLWRVLRSLSLTRKKERPARHRA